MDSVLSSEETVLYNQDFLVLFVMNFGLLISSYWLMEQR